MNYHNITKEDMLNGEGLRVVLWVAGCSHQCKGCQNPITWNPDYGVTFDDNAKAEIFAELEKDYISGITLSGGDPLYCGNIGPVTELAKEIKQKYPNKTIWCYTGGLYEEYKDAEIMRYLDVLVDGEYIEKERDISLPWKGSKNQRVIDVPASIIESDVALLDERDIKFSFDGFTEVIYNKAIASLEEVSEEFNYIGHIRTGKLCFDILIKGSQDKPEFAFDCYVADEDTGYGYKKTIDGKLIPYDYADGFVITPGNYQEAILSGVIGMKKFIREHERLYVAGKIGYSLLQKATEELKIW